jgi:hypothetical protein
MSDVDPQELVTEQDVTAIRTLQLMLCGGAVIYLLVVVGMALTGDAPANPVDMSLLEMLSLAHAALALGALGVAVLAPKLLLSGQALAAADAREILGRLRISVLLRSVVLEGASLLGTTVCLLAVMSGLHGEHAWLWLNSLSTVLLVVGTVLGLVSRQSLIDTLRRTLRR